MRRVVCALSVALLAVAAACTIEPSDLEATEERYLDQLEDALLPLRRSSIAFEETFQELTGLQDHNRFAEELKKIPAARRMVEVFRELDDITPPPRFFRDQRRLMRTIAEMVPVSRTAERLAKDDDIVKSSARFAHAVVLYQRSLLEDTSRFCIVAATTAAERDLCDPIGILPGAGYGERLHASLAKASAEFTPRGFTFVAQVFTSPEIARYLESIGPSLVDGVKGARDEIKQLVPPDEFAADHRVLEEYFTDITRISEDIAEVATEDPARLRRLFPESQRVVNRARSRLSEAIRPAVAVWFFPSSDKER